MTPERFQRIRRVFEGAMKVPPDEREAVIERECAGDADLRREVEELIEHGKQAGGFLDTRADAETKTFAFESGLAPGEVLAGRYRIQRVLGEGSFGVVYVAQDTHLLDKEVVVKVLRQRLESGGWVLKKFRQECEALARIDHPGVITVLDQGETNNGQHFLVMEYVKGAPLRRAMSPEGMCLSRAANIIRQLGDGLAAAHSQGVYHRDLKPENILLKNAGGRETAVIIDFGIAAVKESRFEADAATHVAGSFPYMAPEQMAGRPDASSDTYSLAVIAYEMLSGRRPFESAPPVELYQRQKEGVKRGVRETRPEVSEAAERTLMRALSYETSARPKSAAEFADELACALTCGAQSKEKDKRRHWWKAVAACLVLAALIGGGVYVWRQTTGEGKERAETRGEAGPSLRYYIMVQKVHDGKAEGAPFRLAGEMLFPAEYHIRLMFSSPRAGYFYLVNEAPGADSAAPAYNVLFPSAAVRDKSALLKAGDDIPIPSATDYFVFDRQQGEEKLWMVWSAKAVPELEAVKKWVNPADRGRVGNPAEASKVRQFLAAHASAKTRREIDETARVTNLQAESDPLVHLLRLEHR